MQQKELLIIVNPERIANVVNPERISSVVILSAFFARRISCLAQIVNHGDPSRKKRAQDDTKIQTLVHICSFLCLLVGLYVAIEHTVHFFSTHNYLFSPFADDILDNAHWSYKIVVGELKFRHIFDPFADHKVVVERLQEIFDFIFTNGTQSIQPYRLAALLWLNLITVSLFIIFRNQEFTLANKILLAGAYAIFLFAGMSINNYISTMQITWPLLLLLALFCFIGTEKYCNIISENVIRRHLYILFITMFVNIALYTFNIGVLLWFIVLLLLVKRKCLRKDFLSWAGLIFITYYYYLSKQWLASNWFQHKGHSTSTILLNHVSDIFAYLSRILSTPFIFSAFNQATFASLIIGASIFLSSIFFLYYFLRKTWRQGDTVFFGYFLFNFLVIAIISCMRTVPGKVIAVEWRFLTCSLMLVFCVLYALFLFVSKSKHYQNSINFSFSILTVIWLIFFFLPKDAAMSGGTYDVGFFNQVYISSATGIPIDNHFMQASKIYQTSGDLDNHIYINKIQKKYTKGPFSFWSAQQMTKNINDFQFSQLNILEKAEIKPVYDYRFKQNPGLLINVLVKDSRLINSHWEILFTDGKNRIVGFAISAPLLQPLWTYPLGKNKSITLWRGAINTTLLQNNDIVAWAAKPDSRTLIHLGKIRVPDINQQYQEPTWVWQKTIHYGI